MKAYGITSVLRMPWNDDDIASERSLTLAEAMRLAKETPAEPTVLADIGTTTAKDGRRFITVSIPLDNTDRDVRKKEQVMKKGGKKKYKCTISAAGTIPQGLSARIYDPETKSTSEFPVKTGMAVRMSVSLDLGDAEAVETPAFFLPAKGKEQASPAKA